eukprot:GHRR01022307.1.p1 GENE.GHRR01022307.1~~GHRR01022307.1.p1  ORF type:complete len:234 (+),score=72.64 GHRR01022307.1:180-881(+)
MQQTKRRRQGAGPAAAQSGQQQPILLPVHRYAFAQQLMRKGCMLESSALDTFQQLTGSASIDAMKAMISDQNTAMGSLSMQIRTFKYPVDKQMYIGLINLLADEPSKNATKFSHGQREFFKHVLQAIAADPAAEGGVGSASGVQLLNLDLSQPVGLEDLESETVQAAIAAAKKLTKTEKEQTLRQLCSEGWLRHNPTHSGYYYIGVRSFLELGDLLLSFDLPEATSEAWNSIL